MLPFSLKKTWKRHTTISLSHSIKQSTSDASSRCTAVNTADEATTNCKEITQAARLVSLFLSMLAHAQSNALVSDPRLSPPWRKRAAESESGESYLIFAQLDPLPCATVSAGRSSGPAFPPSNLISIEAFLVTSADRLLQRDVCSTPPRTCRLLHRTCIRALFYNPLILPEMRGYFETM